MTVRKIVAFASALMMSLALMACSEAEAGKDVDSLPAWDGQIPSVVGSGENTKLEFPQSEAPTELQVWPVAEGSGDPVAETDFVVANYEGQVWGSDTPFDSSFQRNSPTIFSLQSVIKGWTQGLAGLPVGSKVVLSIPPALGYGASGGNASAGIGAEDVIAFYVEIVDAFGPNEGGQASAESEADPESLPVTLQGELGEPVTLSVKDGAAEPTEQSLTVLARGTGDPVASEPNTMLVIQYSGISWDGANSESSYGQAGPQQLTVGQNDFFDQLVGVPVGSRVLLLAPAVDGAGAEDGAQQRHVALAYVIDILAQYPPAN